MLSSSSTMNLSTIDSLYDRADRITDPNLSDAYFSIAAQETYFLAAHVPTTLREAWTLFTLARRFVSKGEAGKLVSHAYRSTRRHGRNVDAIVALRKARATYEEHEDHRVELDALAGLIAWMSRLS